MVVRTEVWWTEIRYGVVPGKLNPVTVNSVESNGSANVLLEWDGSVKLNVKFKDIQPRSSIDGPTPNDFIQLDHPNEGSILYSIGDHFRRSQFLCHIGRSFLWINPVYRNIREIGGHRNSLLDMSARLNSSSSSADDIYSIAEEVRKIASENLMNVSLLFRGCSGSGKTELSKHTLQYLLFAHFPQLRDRVFGPSPPVAAPAAVDTHWWKRDLL